MDVLPYISNEKSRGYLGFKEPELTYAVSESTGKMVCIDSVPNGLSCNCRCPQCNERLIARKGPVRRSHFAHQNSNCSGYYMTALHKLAEQIIEEERAVMAPPYKSIEKQILLFNHVEVEQQVERKDLQPDLVGVTASGLRWYIEIRNTHEVDEAKKSKLIESNISCLEIDVRAQTLENLKSFLLESSEKRQWINNPVYESQIAETKRKMVSLVVSYFNDNQELIIPNDEQENVKKEKIQWNETPELLISEGGLYARVKVISSDGTPYIFNIGNHDILEKVDASEHEKECNILRIATDNLPHNDETPLTALDVKWSYNYSLELEKEAKIREYKAIANYEVKPPTDCCSQCKYGLGKCIYLVDTIRLQGGTIVVCNKAKRLKDEAEVAAKRVKDPGYHEAFVFYNKKDEAEVASNQVKDTGYHEGSIFEDKTIIDDYYSKMQSLGKYVSESGIHGEIIKCDKIRNSRIIVLYKEGEYKYHIDIILNQEGRIKRNKLQDYYNSNYAIKSYNERLSYLIRTL